VGEFKEEEGKRLRRENNKGLTIVPFFGLLHISMIIFV
jgi:hypothetical protein